MLICSSFELYTCLERKLAQVPPSSIKGQQQLLRDPGNGHSICTTNDHPLQKGVFLAFGITADDSEL